MKQFFKAFAVAFSMYSKIPMPRFEWASEDMRYHLCFFPLVGAVIGALEVLWYQCCFIWLPGAGAVVIPQLLFLCVAIIIPFLVTGGFHADGFMDTMDALHSWGDREKKLEILKDPHVGAFSIISLLVFVLTVLGFGSVIVSPIAAAAGSSHAENATPYVIAIGFSFVISRAFSGISVTFFPKAKKDGMMATESNTSNKPVVGTVLILELVTAIAACVALTASSSLCGIISPVIMALVFVWYFFMSRKQFGGINGDLAGFFVCISEAASLVAVALCLIVEASCI